MLPEIPSLVVERAAAFSHVSMSARTEKEGVSGIPIEVSTQICTKKLYKARTRPRRCTAATGTSGGCGWVLSCWRVLQRDGFPAGRSTLDASAVKSCSLQVLAAARADHRPTYTRLGAPVRESAASTPRLSPPTYTPCPPAYLQTSFPSEALRFSNSKADGIFLCLPLALPAEKFKAAAKIRSCPAVFPRSRGRAGRFAS